MNTKSENENGSELPFAKDNKNQILREKQKSSNYLGPMDRKVDEKLSSQTTLLTKQKPGGSRLPENSDVPCQTKLSTSESDISLDDTGYVPSQLSLNARKKTSGSKRFLNGTKSSNFFTRLESAEGKKTENSNLPSQTKLPSNSKENTKSGELVDISSLDNTDYVPSQISLNSRNKQLTLPNNSQEKTTMDDTLLDDSGYVPSQITLNSRQDSLSSKVFSESVNSLGSNINITEKVVTKKKLPFWLQPKRDTEISSSDSDPNVKKRKQQGTAILASTN